MTKRNVWAATALATTTFGLSALAQQAGVNADGSAAIGAGTNGSVTAQAAAPPQMQAPPPVAPPAPGPGPGATAAPEAAATNGSDHEAMVGHIAFGYLGYVNIPYGEMGSPAANTSPQAAVAPVIGMRLWLNPTLGLDAGLGLSTTFGTHKVEDPTTTTSTNHTAPTGLAVHFGMPLALKAVRHYTFEMIPEMNIGYATQSDIPAGTNLGIDRTGMHVDLGARVGAELHFGFIGIPELSLVGSVGVRVNLTQTKTEDRTTGTTRTTSDGRTVIETTVGDNPWNIFIGNVSAFYYL
jgi:hypothetical protein